MRVAGAVFCIGAVVAFAMALRGVTVEYRAADFQRADVSRGYAARQAARANDVAVAFVAGRPISSVVAELETAFAVPWYASGRGPGEDSLPLHRRRGPATTFVARDPNSPWYRRSLRAMAHGADFVGRRAQAHRLRDDRSVFAGELVEDRNGITFHTAPDDRANEIVDDAFQRIEASRKLEADGVRRELSSVLRALTLALPYGDRTSAFAEALVLGAHLAFVGEPFRWPRDVRAELDRCAWTSADAEDFGYETGFLTPAEPHHRTVSQEDGGV